jgi:hypothetical protein
MNTENWRNDINRRRTCPNGSLSTSNPTCTDMLWTAVFLGEGVETHFQDSHAKLSLKLADIKIEIFRHVFLIIFNMKFHENFVSSFQIVLCVQTAGLIIIGPPQRSKEAQAYF